MSSDDNQSSEFNRLLHSFHEAQERGDFKLAESIGLQCMLLAAEETDKNPSESDRLVGEAHEHEEAARWQQAEATYLQVLALAEAEGNAGIISKSHHDLGRLYEMLGKTDKALQEAEAALSSARKSNMKPLVMMALAIMFQCHLLKSDVGSAAVVADEAVLITPPEKLYDSQRARALLMRARCRLEQHQVAQAQKDLDITWKILEPRAEAAMFAGIQSCLANWWELTAGIKVYFKDLGGVAQAMSKAIEFRRMVSELPHIAGSYKHYVLAKALKKYSDALMAIDEAEAATKAFDESRKIQQRIGIAIPPCCAE